MNGITKGFYENGNIKYILNETNNIKDTPSYIEYDTNGNVIFEDWSIGGTFHRINGPAVMYYAKNGEVKHESWKFKGKDYTDKANDWIKENNFKTWKRMLIDDFDRMWLEIL